MPSSRPVKQAAPAPRRAAALGVGAGLILLVLLAYLPVLRAGFIWDDNDYLTNNAVVKSAAGLGPIWLQPSRSPQYYPLVFTSFWIEHQLWGLSPAGYHLDNVLLHGLVAVLLWRVLCRLQLPGAWFAAAVFALHPVQAESVAWITERKNVLSAVFALASLLAWLRFFRVPDADRNRRPSEGTLLYAAGVLLFAGALLSKTVTCSLPAVVLVLIWWKRGKVTWREVAAVAPLLVLGAASGLFTAYLERHHVGAVGEEWNLTGLERVLVAGRVFWFYIYSLVWPAKLIFVYPRWNVSASQAWQYIFPIAAIVVCTGLFLARRKIGRGPAAAAFIFAGVIFPASGFINVYPMRYSFVADHFQYHASMAILVLLSVLLVRIWQRISQHLVAKMPRSKTAVPPAGLLLVVLAACTWHACGKYHDLKILWRDTLAKNPSAWIAWNNLGTLFKDEGNNGQAIAYLNEAIRLKPDHSNAHSNLACALIAANRHDEAVVHLRKRIELTPGDGEARLNLANVLSEQGHAAEAEQEYRQAVQLLPNDPVPRYNYALHLEQQNRLPEAVAALRAALAIRSGFAPAAQELARLSAATPR